MIYEDLEIRILVKQPGGYPVEMTLNGAQQFPRVMLDPAFLPWNPSLSPEDDGERLFRWLFASEDLLAAWAEVRGQRPQRRIRLRIDADAPELHTLPWELLRDPGEGAVPIPLAAATATPFSRYLAGKWRPGMPILKRPIRILALIANPDNLQEFELAPVDVQQEFDLLKEALGDLDVDLVPLQPPCNLPALEETLRQGFHILHIISHGRYNPEKGSAVLYLADEKNRVKLVYDHELAEMISRQLADTEQQMADKLRLVFLASCESAVRSPAEAFRGLAPQLVAAGVPAVLAMQDQVSVETARTFTRSFYRQLLAHGQVDLACNEARSTLLSARLPGQAIPVLFMRLLKGQLLGSRGRILGDRTEGFWTTLLQNIEEKWCTPFLGPGVTADLLPSPVELAQELAEEYNYPFPTTESLPRVAQFVATLDNRRLREQTIRKMAIGYRDRMGLKGDLADTRRKLSEIVADSNWSEQSRVRMESEIHHQLADLDLPLYLTTNLDNFMTLALESKGHAPRRLSVNWRNIASQSVQRPLAYLDPPPSQEEPVVLHLFGIDEDIRSLVLTEDDYLDYLTSISRDYKHLIPTKVDEALASTTLLFLGYRLQDLDLKVILRGLLTNQDQSGWDMPHVAVQIDSETVSQVDHEEATRYFQKYFANSKIDVYWGTTQQFVADLHSRWLEYRYG